MFSWGFNGPMDTFIVVEDDKVSYILLLLAVEVSIAVTYRRYRLS
jgi:hypothetical protein